MSQRGMKLLWLYCENEEGKSRKFLRPIILQNSHQLKIIVENTAFFQSLSGFHSNLFFRRIFFVGSMYSKSDDKKFGIG